MKDITHVLFDLGNVLVELNAMPFFRAQYPLLSDREIYQEWLSLKCVNDFESGKLPLETFLSEAPQEMDLDLLPNQFGSLFASWLVGPFEGAVELVQSLNEKYRVGCLSNTNEIHIDKLNSQSILLREFHDLFLSYEIGILKPKAEAYRYVLEAWGVEAKNVLFLDDNEDNVHAAQMIGMAGVQALGLQAAKAVCSGLSNQLSVRDIQRNAAINIQTKDHRHGNSGI